jgi:hypothetical protein
MEKSERAFPAVQAQAHKNGCLLRLWRVVSFSHIIETLQPPSFHAGDIGALKEVYNNIALMEALLLGMGITPFLDMSSVVDKYGSNGWTWTQNISIFLQMGFALCNIIMIVVLLTYISSVDKRERHAELYNCPVFGVPVANFFLSTLFALSFSVAMIYNTMGPAFGYTALAIICAFLVGGGSIALYMFFFRLPKLGHGIDAHHKLPQCSRPGCTNDSRERCCSVSSYCTVMCSRLDWKEHGLVCGQTGGVE